MTSLEMNFTSCSTKRSAVIRASDDFWPRDPASHTIHIASVAYNTIFLGEFMQPDWDMFHVSCQKMGSFLLFFSLEKNMCLFLQQLINFEFLIHV